MDSQGYATEMEHLDQVLNLPEDPSLQVPQRQMPLSKPPGVYNLRTWGQQKFPEGKHKNRTFAAVFQTEDAYSEWMANHKHLTSPWSKSFQSYVNVRRQIEENRLGYEGPGPVPTPAHPPGETARASWELVASSPPAEKPSQMVKRGVAAMDEMKVKPMQLELSADERLEKMTKLALLQKEIAKLQQELE